MATGPFSDDMGLYRVNKAGHMIEAHVFKAPHAATAHDFVVTGNYIAFPVMPRNGTPADINWIADTAEYPSEPCALDHRPECEEPAGYDISINTSAPCVFDAQAISAGPSGCAWVSHRLPVSFHGMWRPAA